MHAQAQLAHFEPGDQHSPVAPLISFDEPMTTDYFRELTYISARFHIQNDRIMT